jgi:hypothetical protein
MEVLGGLCECTGAEGMLGNPEKLSAGPPVGRHGYSLSATPQEKG